MRHQVTQGIINAGLYDSKKGEVEITDSDQARKIRDQVLGGQVMPNNSVANKLPISASPAPIGGTPAVVAQPVPSGKSPLFVGGPSGLFASYMNPVPVPKGPTAPVVPPRSKTLSPGIDMNGNPISYNGQR